MGTHSRQPRAGIDGCWPNRIQSHVKAIDPMQVYIFSSAKEPSIKCFTEIQAGGNLPVHYAPWRPVASGAVHEGDPITKAIRSAGYFCITSPDRWPRETRNLYIKASSDVNKWLLAAPLAPDRGTDCAIRSNVLIITWTAAMIGHDLQWQRDAWSWCRRELFSWPIHHTKSSKTVMLTRLGSRASAPSSKKRRVSRLALMRNHGLRRISVLPQ